MDLGIRVPPCRPVDQVADYLRHVESAGFDFAGVVDSQLITRDAFATCLAGISATERLRIYTAVTNPFTRHSSVIAGAAQTIHEMSPGRFGVIMGSGYSSASTIGRKAATVDEMGSTISEIRRLLKSQSVGYGDADSHLEFADGVGPPILMAATGPRMLKLAGQVADAVLLGVGTHPRMIEEAKGYVREGATSAGRDPDALDLLLTARVVVDSDDAAAQRMARPLCAQWVVDKFRRRWLRAAEIDVEVGDLPESLAELYPDIIHSDNWEQAIDSTAFLSNETVSVLCDALGLIGSPQHCLDRMLALRASGIAGLYLMPLDSYGFPTSVVDAFESEVIPRFDAATPGHERAADFSV